MPSGVLIADIDIRFAAWQRILEGKRKGSIKKKCGITVTISREFGCEAYPLAEKLKNELEAKTNEQWVIFDRALIEKVAGDVNLSLSEIKTVDDGFRFLDLFASFKSKAITKDEIFKRVAEYIFDVAKEGNAIIVGRGSAFITRELKNCHHFRLVAPFDYRVSSISRRLNLDHSESEKYVKENSLKREKFLKDYFELNVDDPIYYDAIFNNQKMDVEMISKSIMECLAPVLKK